MPIQAPQWTEFLSCPICFNMFDEGHLRPISLGCGHTVCKTCLSKLHQKKCPFDQNTIMRAIDELPVNFALLQLVGVAVPESQESVTADGLDENITFYNSAKKCIEELAIYLKPVPSDSPGMPSSSNTGSVTAPSPILSRPMQRKLVTLVSCQLIEEEGRSRAMRAARSLGERTVTELILQHQNPQQLSANLWAAVRARGCQFLGPAMQEEVLKLILLALEDGSALSRKVLVLFVVQRLEAQYPQASKTAIGHVVQLLYRASCFKVTKREEESSLMQLKEEFWTYEALRREHDAQIVQIATEAGLRISPEQWSSLLYGDTAHKSHMQSIIDKLQTPQSFAQSVSELVIALQRTGDPGNLSRLRTYLELLANVDPSPDAPAPSWENLEAVMKAVKTVVVGLVEFITTRNVHKPDPVPMHNAKYKTSMCRDLAQKGSCPRGANCTFAHSHEEMEKYRAKSKKATRPGVSSPSQVKPVTSSALTPKEKAELAQVSLSAQAKLLTRSMEGEMVMAGGYLSSHTSTVSPFLGYDDRRSCVSVPVMKPSSLPMRTRPMDRPAIYTSPVVENRKTELQPILISAPRRMPGLQSQTSKIHGTSPLTYKDNADNANEMPRLRSRTPNESYHRPGYMNTHHQTMPQQHQQQPPREEMIFPPNEDGRDQHVLIDRYGNPMMNFPYASADTQRQTVAMPPNPYTFDNKRNHQQQQQHRENGGSRSPALQLEDLHSRRKELLVQLSTRQGADVKAGSTLNQGTRITSPGLDAIASRKANTMLSSAMANLMGKDTVSAFTTANSTNMPSSVADSMATTHISISLEKQQVTSGVGMPSTSEVNVSMSHCETETPPTSSFQEYIPWSSGADFSNTLSYSDSELYSPPSVASLDNGSEFSSMSDTLYSTSPSSSAWFMPEYDLSSHETLGDDEEFVPYEATSTSKYGPISRGVKVKNKNTGPVQVTADQRKDTTPVTAVTPIQRPLAITSEIPSRFAPPIVHRVPNDHIPDPTGDRIASSLPTALMRPQLLVAAHNRGETEPHTLWSLRGKMLDMPALSPRGLVDAPQRTERDQIRYELAHLTQQIQNLQMSENDRLKRELKAIELNIQETERHMGMVPDGVQLAKVAQEKVVKKAAERQAQESEDRKLAEKLALEEAEKSL